MGILGKTNVQKRIFEGFSLLECRGYDSLSNTVMSNSKASVSTDVRKFGKIGDC
jgi:glucosamine 6-phosphate synthetase-like amidotransferase/phosphosugar isomerase protein